MSNIYKIKYHTEADGRTLVDDLTEVYENVAVEEDAGTASLSCSSVSQFIEAQDRIDVDGGELIIKLEDELKEELEVAFEIGELEVCWL